MFKFKSKAAADLIMLDPVAQRVLELIGKAPSAQGIILPEAMPAALTALQAAIAEDDARRQAEGGLEPDDDQATTVPPAISLRQRAHPFMDMLRRCHAEGEAIVWGV